MKTEVSSLSEHYLATLRKHIQPAARAGGRAAARLGRQAVALGLAASDMARIHTLALKTLVVPGDSSRMCQDMTRRAGAFLAEVIAPMARTQRASLVGEGRMKQLNQTLCQQTVTLTASARHLEQSILQQQATEQTLQRCGAHLARLLTKARRMETHLRDLTHEALTANEQERQTLSHQLQDDIAQTLLSIHVRVLTLKTQGQSGQAKLAETIAGTQRLVATTAQSIKRFAKGLNGHRPAPSNRAVARSSVRAARST